MSEAGSARAALAKNDHHTRPSEDPFFGETEPLRKLVSLIPGGVYTCDTEGRITFFNKRAAELWGREPKVHDLSERFCGGYKVFRLDGSFVPPEQTPMAAALRLGEPVRDLEAIVERPDGSRLFVSVNIDVLRNPVGQITGAINIFQDITQHKLADQSLVQSETRWRTMAEALPNLVWTDLPDGQCDWLGSQWSRYTGIPEQELLGLAWLERVIHPDDRERTLASWQAACQDRAEYDLEYRIRRHDGQYRWFKTRGVPVRDPNGKIIYWFGTCTDIEDVKGAEESAARLAAIVEHSTDAIISKGLDGVIKSWNRGAEQLFGYTAQEAVGRPVTILIPEGHLDEEPEILHRIRNGQSIENYETIRRRKDGTLLDISLTVSPIKDTQGNIIGASKVARDITDKVRAKEKLEHTVAHRTASLRDAIAQMEEFSYTVSHDLRAPLRSIKIYSETLLEEFSESLPQEGRHYVERIASNTKRLDRMVLDVLTFSRVARADIRLEKVSVDRLVRQIVEQYPAMQPPNAQIQIDPLPDVLGHEPSLTQAFSNLINNAIKFVPLGQTPQVRIWSERKGDRVRFWVADNGIGIDPKYHHRLFNMFERIHPDLKYEGTGVGLAIVRKAVERMGGQVGIQSDGPPGTRFWIEVRAANSL